MKKLLFFVIAMGLAGGAAFAETDPAFSGDFEFSMVFVFNDKPDNNELRLGEGGEVKVVLNAVVDEWTTVNAEIEGDINEVPKVNQFTLTTDLLGALGVESPVGVELTFGQFTFAPAAYNEKAGWKDSGQGSETDGHPGIKVGLDIVELVTVNVAIWPSTYVYDNKEWTGDPNDQIAFGVEAKVEKIADMVDVGVYYTQDKDKSLQEVGLTAGAKVIDPLEVGLAFKYDLAGETAGFGVSAKYTLEELLKAGLAFGTTNFSDFAGTSTVALNVVVTPIDVLEVYAGIALSNFSAMKIGYDLGVAAKLGSVTYTLGYASNADLRAPGKAENKNSALYLKVNAEF